MSKRFRGCTRTCASWCTSIVSALRFTVMRVISCEMPTVLWTAWRGHAWEAHARQSECVAGAPSSGACEAAVWWMHLREECGIPDISCSNNHPLHTHTRLRVSHVVCEPTRWRPVPSSGPGLLPRLDFFRVMGSSLFVGVQGEGLF